MLSIIFSAIYSTHKVTTWRFSITSTNIRDFQPVYFDWRIISILFILHCGSVISLPKNVSKKYLLKKGSVFKKTMGGGLTSVVQNYFDKGMCRLVLFLSSDVALIVLVSLYIPRIQKAHIEWWGLLEVAVFETSWRK